MKANAVQRLIRLVRKEGRRLTSLSAESASEKHVFDLYAQGGDLFLIQRGLSTRAAGTRRPVALIRREDLCLGRKGWLFCAGTGNFSTMLTPLFRGDFGKRLCRVPRERVSETLSRRVVLAHHVGSTINLLQRETEFEKVAAADAWLQQRGFALNEVTFFELTPEVEAYALVRGQLWRVRPPRYTEQEQARAVAHSRQRMDSQAQYFISVRGVRWLTCECFQEVAALAKTDPAAFETCLRDWVSLSPGAQGAVAMRRIKYGERHVIEWLGVPREAVETLFIPALERILEGRTIGRMTPEDAWMTMEGIALLFRGMLTDKAFARNDNPLTLRTIYRLIVDDLPQEILARHDFDARRRALPGATFRKGAPLFHPGADKNAKAVIQHLCSRLDINETVEYLNLFDIRSSKDNPGEMRNRTREILLKTTRTPVPVSYVEKQLGSKRAGYADYMLARANAFRALGADYPVFRLLTLKRGADPLEETPYFLRTRIPGDPLDAIDPALFRTEADNPDSAEAPEVVLALAELYGASAAQNLAVKKYQADETGGTCRFGLGKEIFEFVYDPFLHRPMPARVSICSIRGTMGWPDLAHTGENLREAHRFYLRAFAQALGTYWQSHAQSCTLNECASAFFDGFSRKTEAMHWAYRQHQADFDAFEPNLRESYRFREKFRFTLWALEEASRRLEPLREHFMDFVRDRFVKVAR